MSFLRISALSALALVFSASLAIADSELEIIGHGQELGSKRAVTGLRVYIKGKEASTLAGIDCHGALGESALEINLFDGGHVFSNVAYSFESKDKCEELVKKIKERSENSKFVLRISPDKNRVSKVIEVMKTARDRELASSYLVLGAMADMVQHELVLSFSEKYFGPRVKVLTDDAFQYVKAVSMREGKELSPEEALIQAEAVKLNYSLTNIR